MKINYAKLAVTGFKILAAVVGGIAVFAGISKLTKTTSSQEEPTTTMTTEEPPRQQNGFSDTGQKIVDGLKVGQAAIAGTMSIISGVCSVASSINRVFDKNYYDRMLNDPMAGTGYFGNHIIPSPIDGCGIPYGTPMYQGKDTRGDNIYWIQRNSNVVDVW